MDDENEEGSRIMNDVFLILAIVAGYFVLQRWILPRMGVQT